MTGSDGDVDEMPVPLDDRALDALLNGVPSAQSGFDWLLPFVEDLERASQEPAPVVRPALALLLKEGFAPANGTAPATPSPSVAPVTPTPPAVVRPVLRGAAARLAGMGLLAKAGLGFGLVAASTTAAGAVGVLPGPAQHAVATVVGAATPFTFPDKASDKAGTVSRDATGARDGVVGVDGKTVSGGAKTTSSTSPGNTPAGAGVGASNTGATGLDRANQTPAAGHVPTSVPGNGGGPPATPGSKGANGLETADTTPAAGKPPASVPAVTPVGPPVTGSPAANGRGPSANGRGPAATTPAADRPTAGTARP